MYPIIQKYVKITSNMKICSLKCIWICSAMKHILVKSILYLELATKIINNNMQTIKYKLTALIVNYAKYHLFSYY